MVCLARVADVVGARSFIAEVVEPLDMHAVRGLMPVDPLLLLEAHTTSADVRKAKVCLCVAWSKLSIRGRE